MNLLKHDRWIVLLLPIVLVGTFLKREHRRNRVKQPQVKEHLYQEGLAFSAN